MIKRFYVSNFRCLVAFEVSFESIGVFCGPNGSGKSSVFDALRLVRNLATGDGFLGGDGVYDVPRLEFTNWQESTVQEFELEITSEGHSFLYKLHIEQMAEYEKPRIKNESASCDGKNLFERDLEGVRFQKMDGTLSGFPLDWRQSALAAIQPRGKAHEKIAVLKQAVSKLLILQPNPRGMEKESKGEAKYPDLSLNNLTSWYRSLFQEQDWTDALRNSLRGVWPDFQSFTLKTLGLNTKALTLRFVEPKNGGVNEFFFGQLSDGEKALVGLYMVRTALATGTAQTILIDEPDNFVGLPELQPWVLSLRELIDDDHQALIISHHPEILNNVDEDVGRYLWRDNHSSPTRIGPLKIPSGLSLGEAMARGWVNG